MALRRQVKVTLGLMGCFLAAVLYTGASRTQNADPKTSAPEIPAQTTVTGKSTRNRRYHTGPGCSNVFLNEHDIMKERPLTAGEQSLLRFVFGDKINYEKVRIDLAVSTASARGETVDSTIYIDNNSSYWPWSNDYSRQQGVSRSNFIHDMTHVWQFQNNRCITNAGQDYEYVLRTDTRFRNMGSEAQASLIADYMDTFVFKGLKADTPERTLMAQVVERQFPQAKESRENLGKKKAAPANTNNTASSAPLPATGPQ